METTSKRQSRNPGLDGLRGLAALAVALGHCYLTVTGLSLWSTRLKDFPHMPVHDVLARLGSALLPSDAAVTVFFVLSGHVLWQSFSRRQMRFFRDLPAYVAARCYRLLPLTIASGILLGWTTNVPAHDLVENMLLLSTSLNGVLWSLQVEMVGSAMLFVLWGATRGSTWKMALGLLMSVLLLSRYYTSPAIMFLPAFILGAGIASAPVRIWRQTSILVAALPALIFANVILGRGGPDRCVEMIAATLLVGAVSQGRLPFLSRPLPLFLGAVSYPFYLTHPLGLEIVRPVLGALGVTEPSAAFVVLAICSIPLTIVIAWILHVMIEVPVQQATPKLYWPALAAWRKRSPAAGAEAD